MTPRRPNAFTLVELLTIVAMVVLLLALLLPSINKAMYAARLTACKSNLRQIAVGMSVYATDNGSWLPHIPNRYQAKATDPASLQAWNGTLLSNTDTSPTNFPMMQPYMSYDDATSSAAAHSVDARYNPLMKCPQGDVNDNRISANPTRYYSFYNNTLTAQGSNSYKIVFPYYYALDPSQQLGRITDSMYYRSYRNNFGWKGVDCYYKILASDICRRYGVGGQVVITNHVNQDQFINGSNLLADSGVASPNFAFTDGSVRDYPFEVNTFIDTMNMGTSTEGGAEPTLFPKDWGESHP